MESLESMADKKGVSYQKFSDWEKEGWHLVTVKKEVSNYKNLKDKIIGLKDFRIWTEKNCHLVGPSGNHYNISGKGRYGVVDSLDEMSSEFDYAFSSERDMALDILEEIKGLDRSARKYFLREYLDK